MGVRVGLLVIIEVPSVLGGPLAVAGVVSGQVGDEQGRTVPEVDLLVLGVRVGLLVILATPNVAFLWVSVSYTQKSPFFDTPLVKKGKGKGLALL